MKNFIRTVTATAMLLPCAACADLLQPQAQGSISITFEKTFFDLTKASGDVPAADDFILTVTDSEGDIVYNGRYGASPEAMMVGAGNYTVSAVSREFSEPLYEAPQFGDTQIVSVKAGESASVTLMCRQLNSGVRLHLDEYFRTAYPDGVLYLKGSGGTLMYGYTEKRTAYFKPGGMALTLYNDGKEDVLCTRVLEEQQMLTLNLSATVGDGSAEYGRVLLQVDTCRNWVTEYIVAGDDDDSEGGSYSVSEARSHIGENGVWVEGYVVGVATNTQKFSFSAPFSKNTNIALGLRSTTTDSNYMLSVELSKGDIRDALNLVDNPDLLGKKIRLKGNLVDAYYGIPGMKNVCAYEI